MRSPLAILTAVHGLDWVLKPRCISVQELDICRTAFGRFPDFDAGETGFEGIAVCGGRVFIARCIKARKWDFKGRDAVYLAVTWMSKTAFEEVNVNSVFALPYFQLPMRNPPSEFEFDVGEEPEVCDLDCGKIELADGVVLRREIGERRFVQVKRAGEPVASKENPVSFTGGEQVSNEPEEASQCRLRTVLWWISVLAFLVIVLVLFTYDVISRKGGSEYDGSGAVAERVGFGRVSETNGIASRAISTEPESR